METANNRTHTRYAEFKAGLNNKFYEIEVTEQPDGTATWFHRWGRIGTNGQQKPGTSRSFSRAKLDCNEQFQKKLDKGYVEVTAMQALAAACQTVAERPVRGLEPVEIEIPCFGAGSSEPRCREFAQKYLDKMNVVRKSRDDLGATYIDQMLSLIEGAQEEWSRMKLTASHAFNLGPHAEAGYRKVILALREFGLMGKVKA